MKNNKYEFLDKRAHTEIGFSWYKFFTHLKTILLFINIMYSITVKDMVFLGKDLSMICLNSLLQNSGRM